MAKLNTKDLEGSELTFVVSPSTLVQETILDILKYYLNQKGASCVYITVAKPYKTMLNIMSKEKIKTDKVFFIDCITPIGGEDMQRSGNCIFCQPQALTNLSISLTTAIQSLPKDKERVLVLDTVSTLMLYNQSETVTKFIHSLTGKLREWRVKSVIFTLEEEADKKMISLISQFCDKLIKVKE